MGIDVRASPAPDDLPPEFQEGKRQHSYIWAPAHYESFVDGHADEIRRKLGQPDMTREDMLHALIGMPFDEYVKACQPFD